MSLDEKKFINIFYLVTPPLLTLNYCMDNIQVVLQRDRKQTDRRTYKQTSEKLNNIKLLHNASCVVGDESNFRTMGIGIYK